MKTIVTHVSPDQDAVCAVWLVQRFFPGWGSAQVKFVPAGATLDGKEPDSQQDVIHLDTGLGRFDHHQTGDRSMCAATLVFEEVKKKEYVKPGNTLTGLERIVAVVLDVDHAGEKLWPNPDSDRYEFFLEPILEGLKLKGNEWTHQDVLRFGMEAFDGILEQMKSKVVASTILEVGQKFSSPWGKGIGVETANDTVMSLGERMGYMVVVKKDPRRGNVRIYAHPSSTADLTSVYERIQQDDPQSDWFLHASKRLLLNGSSKNPSMRPTKLTLEEVITIIVNVGSKG